MTYEQKMALALSGPSRSKVKTASAEDSDLTAEEKIQLADQWGRELAHADMEKTAFLGRAVGALGNKVLGATNAARVGWGAAGGAGVGAVGGALGAGRDEQGNKKWMSGALGGALLGGAGGAALGAGSKAITQGLARNTNFVGANMVRSAQNPAQLATARGLRGEFFANRAKDLATSNPAQAARFSRLSTAYGKAGTPGVAGPARMQPGFKPNAQQPGFFGKIRNWWSGS